MVKMVQEEIQSAEDLARLTESDYKRLGFPVGLKCKVKRLLKERKKWLVADSVAEFLEGVQTATGSDLSSQISTLATEDIATVSELNCLSDNDFRELGFTIGLKN